jgi:hypothetical protein
MSWIDDILDAVNNGGDMASVRAVADEFRESVYSLADKYIGAGFDPDEAYCIVACYNDNLLDKAVINKLQKELCDLYLDRWYEAIDDTTEV